MKKINNEVKKSLIDTLNKQVLFRYDCKEPEESTVSQLERKFSEIVGAKYAVTMNSCSSALFVSLLCSRVKPGDKVAIPAFTFIAVPSAIIHANATPVLIEITDDLVIDLQDLEKAFKQQNIKALLLSYMRGRVPDLDQVINLCEKYKVILIEDSAHSLGVLYKGTQTGTLGIAGAYSAQSYKMIDAGEGGILVTNDKKIAFKAMLYAGCYEHNWKKHFGTDEDHEHLENITNTLPAFNFRMSNLSAAVLLPQLDELENRVKYLNRNYQYLVKTISKADCIRVPAFDENIRSAPDSIQWEFTGLSSKKIDQVMARLQNAGINAEIFNNNNNARCFWNWEFFEKKEQCQYTRDLLSRTVDLKLPYGASIAEIEHIANTILSATQDNLLVTPEEVEKATKGKWIGDISGLVLKSISNGISYSKSFPVGKLTVLRNREHWGSHVPDNILDKIPKMIKSGSSAFVIERKDQEEIKKYEHIPFLVVENTRHALGDIARFTSKKAGKSAIEKVQITGSEGKTSFKMMLSYLASKQKDTFFKPNSANEQVPILLNMSNIQSSNEVVVMEIACPAKGRGSNRSRIVKPDIAVITNVNPSHMKSHDGIDGLVSDKAESVKGLKPGGYCVLNRDTANYEKLLKKINEFRDDIQILTYGSTSNADSYVTDSNFTDLGWDINALINGQKLTYRVNKIQEYIPAVTTGILTVLDLMGLDVKQASKQLKDIDQWYASSGDIKTMVIKGGGQFLFYDQYFSVTEIALQSALRDVSRITVKGKKIAVISGEHNNSDDLTRLMHERIGGYLNDAKIDYLYTVGEFIDISTNLLTNKSIHKGHFDDIESCTKEIVPLIKDNDLLFIKGMTKLNFKYLSEVIHNTFIEVQQ